MQRFRLTGISILLCLSIGSCVYLNSIDSTLSLEKERIFVEEMDEEKDDILPDVQLIKMLMHKTLEFMTTSPQL